MHRWWDKIILEYRDLEAKLESSYDNIEELVRLQKRIAQLESDYKFAIEAYQAQDGIDFLREADPESVELSQYEDKLQQVEIKYADYIKSKAVKENKLILEIRPGTGGQEAGLFAGSLLEMYRAYAENAGWEWEVLTLDDSDIGGIEQVTISIDGDDAYGVMKYESGVHRVQRIPKTESNGRIHTSTATVAILPEPEEANVNIDETYIRIDVFRASGAGGQHVNKTESAIRLTYEHPDLEKIVISIQDEKSQHKNKSKAMKILRAKVQQQMEAKLNKERASQRRGQVGTGDRSEKIRTYNFQQNRVTDHRSGLSVHNLQYDMLLLAKDLDTILQSLRLAQLNEET